MNVTDLRRLLSANQAGISLAETLVTVSMLTVLAISLFGVILTAKTYKQKSERLGEVLQVMRFAATRFSEDVRYTGSDTWGCPDGRTLTFRDSSGIVTLEYVLDQATPTSVTIHRRSDVNMDGIIDASEDEVIATGLWGDTDYMVGTYLDCYPSQRYAMVSMTILDPSRTISNPLSPPEDAKYTVSTRVAIRK